MTRPKLFQHTNSFYIPIFIEYFKRQNRSYEDYIKRDGEWKKTKEWFVTLDDFKLLIDVSNERWETKKKRKAKRKKKI